MLASSTDIYSDRMMRMFGDPLDTELEGLNGFNFKSFLKKAGNIVKQAAPLVVGIAGSVIGTPALGAAAAALVGGVLNKGQQQQQAGGGGPGPAPTSTGSPAAVPVAGGGGGGGGAMVVVGVGLLALVMMSKGKR